MERTEKKEKPIQVNVDFTNHPELLKQLDKMVDEDMSDRSKFLRRLVMREWERRAQLELPLNNKKAKRAAAVPA